MLQAITDEGFLVLVRHFCIMIEDVCSVSGGLFVIFGRTFAWDLFFFFICYFLFFFLLPGMQIFALTSTCACAAHSTMSSSPALSE